MDESEIVNRVAHLQVGAFTLDRGRGELRSADGALVPLRKQAMSVLVELGRQAGHLVGKEELLRAVWPRVVVGDDSLAQAIVEIRRALNDRDHRLIRTVARRGYMLVPAGAADTAPDAAAPVAAVPVPARRSSQSSAVRFLAGILAAVTVVVALHRDARLPEAAMVAELPGRSLVILPLAVEDGHPDQGWFANNLTADLTTSLSRWQDFIVIGRGTALRYRGKEMDPRQVARELGVRYVIQGSVRRNGDRVHLRLAMIDGATGAQSWGEQFDIERSQLAQSLDDIKGGLARTLVFELGKSAGRRTRMLSPEQVEADDLAMQGIAALLRGLTRESLAEAGRLFEQAVAKDPRSVRGLGGVSVTNSMGAIFQFLPDRDAAQARAEAALARLETIDANDYITFDARASLTNLRGDWKGLLVVAENMIRAFPTDPTPHHHRCSALLRLGRFDDSIPSCERSLRISPRDTRVPIWHGLIAMNRFMQQRYEPAAEGARHTVAGLPNLPFYWLLLVAALDHSGHSEEARQTLTEFRRQHPKFDVAAIVELWPATDPRFVTGRDRIIATVHRLER